jgi:4-alpha-glucanotransferase
VQLDDLLGEVDQINLPGTFVEYPNWRRKNTRTVEQIVSDEQLARFVIEMGGRMTSGVDS